MSTEYYYGTEGNDYYLHNSSDDLVAYGYGGNDDIFGNNGNPGTSHGFKVLFE